MTGCPDHYMDGVTIVYHVPFNVPMICHIRDGTTRGVHWICAEVEVRLLCAEEVQFGWREEGGAFTEPWAHAA